MGRVTNQTTAAPLPSLTIKHFSHPHDLHPLPSNYPQNLAGLCSACKLPSSGMMYTCPPCNFILHQSCAQLPKLITHPAHCSHCSYDLHVRCSIKPLKIRHRAHPCDLNLTFQTPYANSKGFSCDICRMIGEKQWLYRCDSCQFDVHMDCTASQLQILHHHQALPSSNTSHYHSQLMHSASTAGIPSHHGFNQFQGPVNPGGFNGPVPANQHLMQNNQQPIGGGFGSNLLMDAMGRVVEGVMQQVAATAVQEVIGAGDVGGGDAGALSGDVSSY
ncbi:uncharacterized protein LOC142538534 [Primulina tabacum]|uniref:uncharacterized protein LOC142538534 n=1 Tax=Primulina tabacum TaxID=48773 RepID=UPI003F5A0ABF